MKHEAKGHSQNNVKAPGNGAPVKQGIGGCPVLHGAHVRDMGLACVEHPLAQGVEKYVGSQSRRKHHGTPLEGGVLRLFRIPQLYLAVAGKCHVQGAD